MKWIISGQDNKGNYKLISKTTKKGETFGILPKGSFLTTEKLLGGSRVILRVDASGQHDQFSPSPMTINMDLSSLSADQKSLNVITAYPVDFTKPRKDGLIDAIPPNTICRRSSNEEIDLVLKSDKDGPPVFLATFQSGRSQILIDNNTDYVHTNIPCDAYFHQMLVCGKTGIGKTVALKYLAQHFVEEFDGAVLAINVKEQDFLYMNRPSSVKPEHREAIDKEWEVLGKQAKGVTNTMIYYPGTESEPPYGVDAPCDRICLNVQTIEPEALTGLLINLTELGSQSLPDIFRYWREIHPNKPSDYTFNDFVDYFNEAADTDPRWRFHTLNEVNQENTYSLHSGVAASIQKNLISAQKYFDLDGCTTINESHILQKGQLSVINVVENTDFGSVILRDLLYNIDKAKSAKAENSDVPILIIIDEVHEFYGTSSSKKALGTLGKIARTGRSKKMGIIFASQNPSDIPSGLGSVVNSHIYLKTDADVVRKLGMSPHDALMLGKGFAIAQIFELHQAKLIKFPLSYAGVVE